MSVTKIKPTPEQTDKINRAAEAQSLLDNKLFKDAFSDVKDKLIEQIEACPIDNDTMRNQLMLSLQILKQLRLVIVDHIDTGKLQEKALEQRTVLNRKGIF